MTLARSADLGVLIIDRQHRIMFANCAAGRMFGYGAVHLVGSGLDRLLPEKVQQLHMQQLERFAATEVAGRRLRIKLDVRGRRANGEEFFVDTSVSRISLDGERFLSLIVRELRASQHPVPAAGWEANLAGSSQRADEIEKRHFSRVLYDDIGQRLGVLKLDLDWCQQQPSNVMTAERLLQMQCVLDELIISTKNIASRLRPPLLDDFGLVAAIEWITDRFIKRTGIACSVRCRLTDFAVSELIDSALFRIVQEGLQNIEQHARARHVDITLWRTERHIHVVIEDDGIGMEFSRKPASGGLGLLAMHERISILGGTIHIKNMEPSGVAILASLPVEHTNRSVALS